MKKLILILIIAATFSSCMSFTEIYKVIPENTVNEIPLKANRITITNDLSLSDNYNVSYKTLLSNDYKIDNDNKEMGYILASKQDIGDTYVRLNFVCNDNSIKITSEWTAGTQTSLMMGAMTGITPSNFTWYQAEWNKSSDKPTIAFANAVKVAKQISPNIEYYPNPDAIAKEKVETNGKKDFSDQLYK